MESLAQDWLKTVGLLRGLVMDQPVPAVAPEAFVPGPGMACREALEARRQQSLLLAVEGTNWVYSHFWRLNGATRVLEWSQGVFSGPPGAGEDAVVPSKALLQQRRKRRQVVESVQSQMFRNDGQIHQEWMSQLTPLEWFYISSSTFFFPPNIGCPGQASGTGQVQWLCGAGSRGAASFTRADMAKAAGIQTVVCIPVEGGVVEIGTVDLVPEDPAMVDFVRCLFSDPGLQAVGDTAALLKLAMAPQSPVGSRGGGNHGDDSSAEREAGQSRLLGSQVPQSPRHQTHPKQKARFALVPPTWRGPPSPGSMPTTPNSSSARLQRGEEGEEGAGGRNRSGVTGLKKMRLQEVGAAAQEPLLAASPKGGATEHSTFEGLPDLVASSTTSASAFALLPADLLAQSDRPWSPATHLPALPPGGTGDWSPLLPVLPRSERQRPFGPA